MQSEAPKPDWAMSKKEQKRAAARAAGEPEPKSRKWPWLVALVLVVGGGAAYVSQNQPAPVDEMAAETSKGPEPIQLASYESLVLAPRTVSENLRITGSLTPTQQVHLSAEVSARLVDVTVRAGDAVKAGQLLAQFDIDGLENQLAQSMSTAQATRVQVEKARADFERTQTLVERELAAETALLTARAGLQQLEAQLSAQEKAVENAQAAIEKARVTAPFDGVISDRSVDPGAFIATGSPLLEIVDLTSLEVEASAPVALSPQLTLGQAVDISVEGFGDRTFEGVVERINPVAIEGSRMLPLHVSLSNGDGLLRGGMFATGQIELDRAEGVIAIPAEALRIDADGEHVLVVTDGVLTRQSIDIARSWANGTLLEVREGLADGDRVIAASLPTLRPGQPVALPQASE